MRIVCLVAGSDPQDPATESALGWVERLRDLGHEVVVASSQAEVEPCDTVVATSWRAVHAAVACGRGAPVHLCACDELATAEAERGAAEATYRRRDAHRVAIGSRLAASIATRFACEVYEVADAEPSGAPPPVRTLTDGTSARVGWVGELAAEAVERVGSAGRPAIEAVPLAAGVGPDDRVWTRLDLVVVDPGTADAVVARAALAHGVPCVLTDVAAHRAIWPSRRDFALLVEPDVDQLVDAIDLLGRHAALRLELQRAGLDVASRLGEADPAAGLQRVLECIVTRSMAVVPPA